ncbi:MAG: putative sulfate/molybdate transporter [Candidatus Hydrothermarchaeota archaeon]
MELLGNRFDRAEFAGAFGDLGTFIPFVVAYITINKMDPLGILLAFGLFKIFVGLYFKTPVPVQPMKAIGGYAIANPGTVTHGMIWGSGVFTAFLWAGLALVGAVDWLARVTTKPIVRGIMLGLGLTFVVEGAKMMNSDPLVAVAGVVLAFLFLTSTRLPAMLLLLAFGIAVSVYQSPSLLSELGRVSIHLRLPELTLGRVSWSDLVLGTLILGIPQAPLTLGNAIIGITAENNELFPDRKVKVRTMALDHGLMNIVSAAIGGVPMCHGAGGMAGHVRFGARTGGALVILGTIVVVAGLFLSDSILTLLRFFPLSIIGVILFFTGLELASIMRDIGTKREDIYVMLVTAGLAIWNMGVAFAAGVLLYHALKRDVVRV